MVKSQSNPIDRPKWVWCVPILSVCLHMYFIMFQIALGCCALVVLHWTWQHVSVGVSKK